jgi:putative phosphoribosyl transferase
VVIGLNQRAHTLLSCKKKLSIIPGATHLFEEPGTLEQAADWFKMHLGSNPGE